MAIGRQCIAMGERVRKLRTPFFVIDSEAVWFDGRDLADSDKPPSRWHDHGAKLLAFDLRRVPATCPAL
ncbi:hypothetical protein [Bradyrhizobium sp.]|uniref:hypothetical protein n=1 Tax=Bradyrhizobium sp. TaxID=376 RepID=UPI001D1B3E3D|nr:hypothetical protein [Bradyrhizobium sp.]MBI5319518.1 hypothetical protein [Bradyrhizobium sp.]